MKVAYFRRSREVEVREEERPRDLNPSAPVRRGVGLP